MTKSTYLSGSNNQVAAMRLNFELPFVKLPRGRCSAAN
jgi:hypothetical protein